MSDYLPSRCSQIMRKHQGPVSALKFDSQGEYCLSGGNDKKIYLWNPSQAKLIMDYEGHSWEVLDIAILPDNSKFSSVGGDRSAFFFDVLTGKPIRKFSGHTQRINCCNFNNDGAVLATGSYDASVRLWDLKSHGRVPIQILEDSRDSVTSVQIQGYEILVGCVDGHIRNYDVRTGALLVDSIGVPITSVSFSIDNTSILCSSLDNTIRLLDKSSGSLLNEYKGHVHKKYKINSCYFLNDSFIVSGSENGSLYFWDFIDGKVLKQLEVSDSPVTSITVHPSEPIIVCSSIDGSIRFWQR